MIMSWIWTGLLAISIIAAVTTGNGGALSAAIPKGAQAGITLAVSMAGSVCLWTGVGKLMESAGLTKKLARILRPLLRRLFPSTKTDSHLENRLSANICAKTIAGITPHNRVSILQVIAGATVSGEPSVDLVHPTGLTATVEFI